MSDYKTGICHRLRRAAGYVRDKPGSRQHLESALQAIGVFGLDQFPADFRNQYLEIMAAGTRNETVSFPEAVAMMSAEEMAALEKKIVELYVAVCEPTDLKR